MPWLVIFLSWIATSFFVVNHDQRNHDSWRKNRESCFFFFFVRNDPCIVLVFYFVLVPQYMVLVFLFCSGSSVYGSCFFILFWFLFFCSHYMFSFLTKFSFIFYSDSCLLFLVFVSYYSTNLELKLICSQNWSARNVARHVNIWYQVLYCSLFFILFWFLVFFLLSLRIYLFSFLIFKCSFSCFGSCFSRSCLFLLLFDYFSTSYW